MNENARKWVEALRSGEYTQTREVLKDASGFCCLGVACDLYAVETGRGRWEGDVFRVGCYGADKISPPPVRDWLGLVSGTGSYQREYAGMTLTGRNDKGASFAEIADLIESEPEGLFA